MSADIPVTSTPVSTGGEVSQPNTAPEAKIESEERFKVKINGKERELTRAEMIARASKDAASEEKFQEASRLKKEAEEILESVKGKNFAKTLAAKGYSKQEIRELLEAELTPFIEDELLTPEERAQREKDERLRKYEEEEEKKRREEEMTREERELARDMDALEAEFIGAISAVGLPKHPWLGKIVAHEMLGAAKQGYELTAKEAAQMVKTQYDQFIKTSFSELTPAQKKEFLGKDTLSELRKADVNAIKDAERPFAKPRAAKQDTPQSTGEKSKQEASSFFNKLRGVNYNKK